MVVKTLGHIFAAGMVFCQKIMLLLMLYMISHLANGNSLTVKLPGGLPSEVERNVRYYLGKLPTTQLERSAFLYSAKENTLKALQALGYYQASVHMDVNKNPWQLISTITLHTPTLINKIDVTIIGEAKDDSTFIDLINKNSIQVGDKLHHGKYESLKSYILSIALQRGYLDGRLLENSITINEDYDYASIKITYESGTRYRFGDVSFNNFELDEILLSSLIPFKQGEYYNTKKFHQLQHQLQSTQYFSNVHVTHAEKIQGNNSHQNTIPINAALTPAKSHQVDFGIGYATDTQFRLSVGWKTPLINQNGHYQETKIEYSPLNPTGKFIYNIPLSHPTNDLLRFKVNIENDDFADLTTKFYSVQIGHVFSKNNWNRQVYARLHQEAWQYDLDEESPNIIWSEKDNVQYLIPGITWSKTTRSGSALDPSTGFRQTYNIEGAHLSAGSDNSFFRIHGRWNYITTLKPKHRFVARAELGAIFIDEDAQLAPSLRFYAGGDQSIRGFAYQSIGSTIDSSSDPTVAVPVTVGGTRLALASLEYQYYVNRQWRLAIFSDGGSVTNKDELNPVYSIGSGIHYLSPVGAVKLDFAYGAADDNEEWRIHLNLGAEL